MQLQNTFLVPAGIDRAWDTLTDVHKVAPCLPGATLGEVDGDDFAGSVKVKLGPVTMNYGGKATFLEKDKDRHVAVFEGAGKETRGSGTAKIVVLTSLHEVGPESTRVEVTTDLTVTGKAAQFGRGVMQDVAGRLVDQFADNLAAVIAAPEPTTTVVEEHPTPDGGTVTTETVTTPPPVVLPHQGEAIDLMSTAGAPVLKRVLPVALGALVLGGLLWWIVSRRRRE